jgi:CubicO group peptidase (beta-lactamase class C family)
VNLIEAGDFGKIHSLIIIHNDSLVMEEYFMGWTRHMLHHVWSITKSVTSALIGIAIDQGLIDSVDEKLLSFFPEYDDIQNLDERKESITLEHVLTMTVGFDWKEIRDVLKMSLSGDYMKYTLDLPITDDPGTKMLMNYATAMLLSGIIANTTGQSTEEFAEENLFEPLGITHWEWDVEPNDLTDTGGGLVLHPVNMVMFGYLFLKNGLLNGEQIVSENWVRESTAVHMTNYQDTVTGEFRDYGYLWWRHPDERVDNYLETNDLFFTRGAHGQRVFVIPHLNMVVGITADNAKSPETFYEYKILYDYILPAVREN